MKPYLHARISVKKFGGTEADYMPIHDFIDSSKSSHADMRHRAILHSAFGIYVAELVFGTMEQKADGTWVRMPYIVNADGEKVQVRDVAEQHVLDDLGRIPSLTDWLKHMTLETWMGGPLRKVKHGKLADFLRKSGASREHTAVIDGGAPSFNAVLDGGQPSIDMNEAAEDPTVLD